MKQIPFVKPLLPKVEDYNHKVVDVFESNRFTNHGKYHQLLLLDLKKYLDNDNLSLFVNGHMALESVIEMFELKGEIITTAFTFPSTSHAIIRKGCEPIFCDIKEDFTIDENLVESLITEKTVAIIAVHVFGNICALEKLQDIANKHHIKLIYDAAHAFSVKYNNLDISHYGDASMFSMNITKPFNTIEGGIISFKDPRYNLVLEKIKYYGFNDDGDVDYIGSNLKMNEMQAIMGVLTLPLITEDVHKRKRIDEYYRKKLSRLPINLLEVNSSINSNYAYFPILLKDEEVRNHLFTFLKTKGIETKKYFYPIITQLGSYKEKYSHVQLSKSMDLAKRILVLPIYSQLSVSEMRFIGESIIDFFREIDGYSKVD